MATGSVTVCLINQRIVIIILSAVLIKIITLSYELTHLYEETSIPAVLSFRFCNSLRVTPDYGKTQHKGPRIAQCSSDYLACRLCRKFLRSENSSKTNRGGKDKKCLIVGNIFNICHAVIHKSLKSRENNRAHTADIPASTGKSGSAQIRTGWPPTCNYVPQGSLRRLWMVWRKWEGRVPLCIDKGLLNRLCYTCIIVLLNGHSRKTYKKVNKEDKRKERRKNILYKLKERLQNLSTSTSATEWETADWKRRSYIQFWQQ